MSEITVKICGLMSENDISMCIEYGADIIGMVVDYPVNVHWNLKLSEAEKLRESVKGAKLCIVTGGKPDKIINIAEKIKPSLIQLHFNEPLCDVRFIADALKRFNIGVIKAFPMDASERMLQTGTDNIKSAVEILCGTNIYGILVDSRNPENAKSSGKQVDLEIFKQIKQFSSKPVFLAGGITPENVNEILRASNAGYIDVMTGVEKDKSKGIEIGIGIGIKDFAKVKALFSVLRKRNGAAL